MSDLSKLRAEVQKLRDEATGLGFTVQPWRSPVEHVQSQAESRAYSRVLDLIDKRFEVVDQ